MEIIGTQWSGEAIVLSVFAYRKQIDTAAYPRTCVTGRGLWSCKADIIHPQTQHLIDRSGTFIGKIFDIASLVIFACLHGQAYYVFFAQIAWECKACFQVRDNIPWTRVFVTVGNHCTIIQFRSSCPFTEAVSISTGEFVFFFLHIPADGVTHYIRVE